MDIIILAGYVPSTLMILGGKRTDAKTPFGIWLPFMNVRASVPESEPSRGGSWPGRATEAKTGPAAASARSSLTASTWTDGVWMLKRPSSWRVSETWASTDWTMSEVLRASLPELSWSGPPEFRMTLSTVSTTKVVTYTKG